LVLKVDADAAPAAASAHRISGLPTFVLFNGGREAARRSGVASRPDLEGWIARARAPQARAG
jgi:thioredoxin 2